MDSSLLLGASSSSSSLRARALSRPQTQLAASACGPTWDCGGRSCGQIDPIFEQRKQRKRGAEVGPPFASLDELGQRDDKAMVWAASRWPEVAASKVNRRRGGTREHSIVVLFAGLSFGGPIGANGRNRSSQASNWRLEKKGARVTQLDLPVAHCDSSGAH